MKEVKIKVYTIKELNETAKEKALNLLREDNSYDFLSEDLEERLRELLKDNKIKVDYLQIYYSLSYSQGDGVCFVGNFEYKDYPKFIKHIGNYNHKNSVEIDILDSESEEVMEDDICEEFKEIFDDICDQLEKIGYNYIEYVDSEENLIDMCEINEYTFLENGEMFNSY